jgi:hypothetical protein
MNVSASDGADVAPGPRATTPAAVMWQGAARFAIVSLAAFALWAAAGRWFYQTVGEAGLYAATTVVFVGLSGLLLHPLLDRAGMAGFYRVFVPAFLAYAVAWSIAWFLLHFGAGEWLGSAAGSAAFVASTRRRLGSTRPVLKAMLVFFLFNSCGYFLGGMATDFLGRGTGAALLAGLGRAGVGVVARLAWGLFFGLGFGAGMGYVFHALRRAP